MLFDSYIEARDSGVPPSAVSDLLFPGWQIPDRGMPVEEVLVPSNALASVLSEPGP